MKAAADDKTNKPRIVSAMASDVWTADKDRASSALVCWTAQPRNKSDWQSGDDCVCRPRSVSMSDGIVCGTSDHTRTVGSSVH